MKQWGGFTSAVLRGTRNKGQNFIQATMEATMELVENVAQVAVIR